VATLSELQAHLAALEAARGNPDARVRSLDREVTYRGIDEIEKAISAVKDEIAKVGGTPKTYRTRFNTRSGW
jgi:hypothetical protein